MWFPFFIRSGRLLFQGAGKFRISISRIHLRLTALPLTTRGSKPFPSGNSQRVCQVTHSLAPARMGFLRLATFLAAARLLGGVALADDTAAATPPSDDPWYTAPEGYEDALPGALLRKRTAQGNIANKIGANCSAAFNLLYRTTASQGNATFAVTTVLVPKKPTNALLSYQIPYDSAYINSSPSYALTQGGIPSDIGIALGKGYFVTVPDYVGAVFIGPPAPYFMVSSEQVRLELLA